MNEIEIVPITADDLRADHSGILIEQIARLAFECFREPPWNDDHAHARLHFGVGVDLMRRNALGLLARAAGSRRALGYSVGYEVVTAVDDLRDLSLADISGTADLDDLFDGGSRVLYWDTLCLDRRHRRRACRRRDGAAAATGLRPLRRPHGPRCARHARPALRLEIRGTADPGWTLH
jgi:hypothetical protein